LNFVSNNKGSENDAQDLWQDVIISFYENVKKGAFRGESSIRTYVFSIARNMWLEKLKMRTRMAKTTDRYLSGCPDKTPNIEELITEIETEKELEHALRKSRSEDREILRDFYFDGLKNSEIKDKYGLGSIQAAKNKKCRALRNLRYIFKRSEETTALSGCVKACLRFGIL